MTKDQTSIPMSSPDLGDAERKAVQAVLHTPNLSMGKEILSFEHAFCDFSGSKHAIAVNSGTAGLHLCVRAAGIQDGDLVITTPFSFIASANVLLYERAVPVFVDVEPQGGNIDPHLVYAAAQDIMQGGKAAEAWLPRKGADPASALKAILPVDVFGQPADMLSILKTANQFNLKVIEDSCEALGAIYLDRPAGAWGHYGVYAFYPNKQITTGEGGVIVTNDAQAADLMRAMRNQGRSVGDTWLQHTYLGYNYRLDEMSAAIGRVQMERLPELLGKRAQVAEWYHQRLASIPEVELPYQPSTTTRSSWFVYVVRFAKHINREDVIQALAERGIPGRPYFSPIHLQPFMMDRFGFRPGDFPVTEDLGRRSLALPFSGVMTEAQVDRVCSTLKEIL